MRRGVEPCYAPPASAVMDRPRLYPRCSDPLPHAPVPLNKRSVVIEKATGGGGGKDRHRGRGPHRAADAGHLVLPRNPCVCCLCHRCVQPAGLPSTARQTGRVAAMTCARSGLAAAGGWLAGARGPRCAAHHRGGHAACAWAPWRAAVKCWQCQEQWKRVQTAKCD